MKRDIEKILNQWKYESNRMPLMIRGARQVGKSYTITEFGKREFENLVTINFEQQPEYALLLSWHISDELIQNLRRKGYRGKFIIPLPEPRIVEGVQRQFPLSDLPSICR